MTTEAEEDLKVTIRDMLPFIEEVFRDKRGVTAAVLHGLILRARGQIGDDPRATSLPRVPGGAFVAVLLSPDAAVQTAAALAEHTTYPHLMTAMREIALSMNPDAGRGPGTWYVHATPLPEAWIEALRIR